ncbi:PTS transporter subunit EIIC [Vibrio sp. TH_r3]|uniref:PTS sugar transporter subunit IIC n=1 Tax=Vibrio sp. TH_r3 TaxID=3082084 RepID=UPI0029541ADB|nr:PTS transporter subunit EIIC [Vibrio sp. TH_r3]MDV7105096.1 PTS transporter subunit EIIC [Vibrio sp. TH_r3]
MKVLESFFNRHAAKINAFAANKYVSSVRDTFISTLPIIMPASFFILFSQLVLNPLFGLPAWLGDNHVAIQFMREMSNLLIGGTLNMFALFACFKLASLLAAKEGKDPIGTGLIALAAFYIITPDFSVANVSSKGLFAAVIVSILATRIFHYFLTNERLKIKMPDQVPPAVAKAFSDLLPATLTLVIFSAIAALFSIYETSLPAIITLMIQAPLANLAGNIGGLMVVDILQNMLWIFGIHGGAVLGGIKSMLFAPMQDDNLRAVAEGVSMWDLPHDVTWLSYDLYANVGGAGASLALLISILIASRRVHYKKVAQIALIPCLFNICETMVFGLPIILNPLFAIPFVLAPTAMLAFAGFVTYIGLAPPLGILVPWTTPVGLGAFLASGGAWQAGLLALCTLSIGVLIYLPFVKLANKAAAPGELIGQEGTKENAQPMPITAQSNQSNSAKELS